MKIIKNTSGYESRALRAVIIMAHNEIRKFEGHAAPNWAGLRVLIRGRDKGDHVSGCAYVRGRGRHWDVCLTVPRPNLDARKLLWLAYHELLHTYGYHHRDFRDIAEHQLAEVIPANYAIPMQRVTRATPTERTSKRIASLITRQRRWETRLKRAQTAIKKIRTSLRHYERKQPVLLAALRGKTD